MCHHWRNLVTEMSLSLVLLARKSLTAASSRRKWFRADVRNLVTEMSLAS